MAHLPKYLRFAIFKSNVLSISCCLMRHSLLFLTVYDLTAVATVVYLTSYYSRTLSFPPHLIIYGTQTSHASVLTFVVRPVSLLFCQRTRPCLLCSVSGEMVRLFFYKCDQNPPGTRKLPPQGIQLWVKTYQFIQ